MKQQNDHLSFESGSVSSIIYIEIIKSKFRFVTDVKTHLTKDNTIEVKYVTDVNTHLTTDNASVMQKYALRISS